jgi:hypothetical protein
LAAVLSSVTPAFVAGRESKTLIPRPSKSRMVLRLDISVAEMMEMGYADVTETMSTETLCPIGPIPIRQKMS